jgi:hypothetical protein
MDKDKNNCLEYIRKRDSRGDLIVDIMDDYKKFKNEFKHTTVDKTSFKEFCLWVLERGEKSDENIIKSINEKYKSKEVSNMCIKKDHTVLIFVTILIVFILIGIILSKNTPTNYQDYEECIDAAGNLTPC